MVGIEANLRGKIEGHRQARGAVGEQVLIALIGLFSVTHPGVLPHRPESSAVHRGLDASGVWKLAGIAEILFVVPVLEIVRAIELPDGYVRRGLWISGFSWRFGPLCHGYFFFRARINDVTPNHPNIRVKPAAAATRDAGAWPER